MAIKNFVTWKQIKSGKTRKNEWEFVMAKRRAEKDEIRDWMGDQLEQQQQ